MRWRGLRAAVAVALAAASVAGVAHSAATVDPVALAMQQSIKKALQAKLKAAVPGLKVTTVKCTVTTGGRRGICKASFAYRTIIGYYMLKVRQPPTGRPSYTSTSVACFDAKTRAKISCSS